MTDTEPTPPARPAGPLDDATPAPSPWVADPPADDDRWGGDAGRPDPDDTDRQPQGWVHGGDTWSSGSTHETVTQPLPRPVPPVAVQPWAAPPTAWTGSSGSQGEYQGRPGQYEGRPGQFGGYPGRYPGQPGPPGQPPSQYSGWGEPSGGTPSTVDTLGRTRRGRGGRAGFVALVVALALVAGLVGGVLGSTVADRGGLAGLVGGSQDTAGSGDGSASSPDDVDDADPAAAPAGDTGSVAEIAARVLPSVVSISVSTGQGDGTGSGFVIDDEGLIVTNNHVIAAGGTEPAGDIVVELSDGSQADAEVVGADASYDIAVLRIDPADTGGLTELSFGDSDRVVVGEQVVAVGAPLGLDATVTTGIVSALNRPVSAGGGAQQTAFINAIQTDAAINPGNSGGPLVNMRGEVVGVNSAIAQAPGGQTGGSIGLGFSIPSNQAARTAGQLVEDGVATFPVVGVLLDRQYRGEGVRIVTEEDATDAAPVTPGGPADAAGLRAGDVILAFDGRPMTESDELVVAIRAREPGDEVTLTVRRGDEVFDVSLVLEAGDQD